MKIGIEPINHPIDFHIFSATRYRTAKYNKTGSKFLKFNYSFLEIILFSLSS